MTVNFFDFSENNTHTLFSFLQESIAKNYECEIRFGRFYQDRQKQNNKTLSFDSNVEPLAFYNLKRNFCKQKFEKKESITVENIFQIPDSNVSIREITSGNKKKYMTKQHIKKYDIYDYDMRISVSKETEIKQIPDNSVLVLVRKKKRTSFILPFGVLDLTIVEQTKSDCVLNSEVSFEKNIKYEIEMEMTSLKKNEIMSYLMMLLQTLQDNYFVISSRERRQVISEYKTLVNNNYFVGAQPETLQKDKISKIYKMEYSVTDKADGERAFLLINNTGIVYFIDNNIQKACKTDVTVNGFANCLIDGEIVKYDNKICFLAFDLLVNNNIDLRGDKNFMLKKRLGILDEIIKQFNVSRYYKISLKKYYFGNVFSASKIILENSNLPYTNDGLIFTPVDEPYPIVKKWQNLLKWKPSELNTIDFYSKCVKQLSNGQSVWNLYVQGEYSNLKDKYDNNVNLSKQTEKILFDVSKLHQNVDNINVITYETTFNDDLIDPTTGEPYKSDSVIEFKWCFDKCRFVPLRTRWDKTNNPKKHGNYFKVACDVWNNINNPVDKDFLFKFYSSIGKRDNYESMRNFHNKIKEKLYNNYCKSIERLLELCSGRGGDMHKWIFNDIKNVVGYDVSEKHIEECKRRLDDVKNNPNSRKKTFDYQFYKLDLTSDNASDIISKRSEKQFDVISCQFGMHYFFSSEKTFNNYIDILEKNLKTGGYFITTFMDDVCLKELFKERDFLRCEKNNEIVYCLEKNVIPNRIYGNELSITLSGNNILNEGSQEWIINYQTFVSLMNTRGFSLVETQTFYEMYETDDFRGKFTLCDYEKDISFLNRYCVFKKDDYDRVSVDQIVFNSIQKNINYNSNSEFNFHTINLYQNGITVQRITSLYDIIDIINCIEYKYYKNEIANVQLDDVPEQTFFTIENYFKKLNIDYKLVFVNDPLDFTQYITDDITNNIIRLTYHKHVIEKKILDQDDITEYNNWYIIMYNDKLVFDYKCIQNGVDEHNVIQQNFKEQNFKEQNDKNTNKDLHTESDEHLIKSKGKIESEIKKQLLEEYNSIKKNGDRFTIRSLKEFLKRAGLKISGNRDELQKRLETYLFDI